MEKELNSQNVEIKDLKEKVEGLMGKFESWPIKFNLAVGQTRDWLK